MKLKTLILCLVLLVSACSNAPVQSTVPPTIIPTSTLQPTETPQPTPTYFPITPGLQGTQLPEHGNVITVENIDRLTLLSNWGKGNPTDVIYTPDGKYFVVCTSTGLYFYDPEDYSLIHFIDTETAIFDIAASPDSQTIAAVTTNEIFLYQISDWQLMLSIKVDANSVDFSPDSQKLALGINSDPDSLQLRDAKTGEVIVTAQNEQAAWAVKISPRGDVIATGGYSTTIWSLDGSILDQYGPYVSGGHTASVSFSPDGEFLAEGSDYFLKIWRVLDNGRIINYREIDLSQFSYASVFDVAISPDGKLVATALSSGIGVWDLSTGRRVFYSAADDSFTIYNSLAWSSDSSTIAAASNQTGVKLWSITTGENLITLNSPSGSFSTLAWSPDGQKLGVGAEEGIAYIFNTHNGLVLKEFGSGYELNSVAFSPVSQTIALGYGDRTAQIWNLDGTLQQTIEGFGVGSSDVTFSSDSALFAAILPEGWQTPPQVRIWNTSDWSVEKVFAVGDRENYLITGFALSSDQNTGAISYVNMHGYHKDFIKIISIKDGTTLSTLEPKSKQYRVFIDAMAYSPDNTMLAALVSEFDDPSPRILVWQTHDWSLLFEKAINAGPRLGFSKYQQDALAWSSDSDLLAVGLKDGNTQIFNSVDGKNLATLNGHTMWVTGVSFSPDGHILASISLDGTIMLWGLR
jgi:WD40 repeat protein